jgi:hypothetical protein
MDNSGVKTLVGLQIGAAMPQSLLIPTGGPVDLSGMTAISLEAEFKYGSGGATVVAVVVTSFDGGTTWRNVARFDFATSSRVAHCNLEGLLSKGITTYSDLGAEGVYDGILGDRLAVLLTTAGVYSNTTIAIRVSAR